METKVEENLIKDGYHVLSGIGSITIDNDWGNPIDVDCFCIDGVTYGAYIDADDGYRSYGIIQEIPYYKCEVQFPPQPIKVENQRITEDDDAYNNPVDKKLLIMTDAQNGKEVLVVGTDLWDAYYPMAIFRWSPQNLEVNQNK